MLTFDQCSALPIDKLYLTIDCYWQEQAVREVEGCGNGLWLNTLCWGPAALCLINSGRSSVQHAALQTSRDAFNCLHYSPRHTSVQGGFLTTPVCFVTVTPWNTSSNSKHLISNFNLPIPKKHWINGGLIVCEMTACFHRFSWLLSAFLFIFYGIRLERHSFLMGGFMPGLVYVQPPVTWLLTIISYWSKLHKLDLLIIVSQQCASSYLPAQSKTMSESNYVAHTEKPAVIEFVCVCDLDLES